VSFLRAVMRRLDPWAALLLGVLVALGVVILLATPGPWHRVVGPAPAVTLTPPPPDDVAVFVLGGRGGSCSGVVWLHIDADESSLTAVVIPRRVVGFVPGAGYAPLSDVVDAAGPRAAAAALGEALDVPMDAWVTLDRRALAQAVEPMFPMDDVHAARGRYRLAFAAWKGKGGVAASWRTQYETLREALPQVPFHELNVVAFSNYVLGFGFVRSDLTLQDATSLADTLREIDPGRVEVRAAGVVVETSRAAQMWHVDASRLESLRLSLALGLVPPDDGARIVRRLRAARVLVVAPMPAAEAAAYVGQLRRSLRRFAGAPVEIRSVAGVTEDLAFRAARALDRRAALAVLVAPPDAADADAAAVVAQVYAMLRRRGQDGVAAGPLGGPATSSTVSEPPTAGLRAVVAAGELPVSWAPDPPVDADAISRREAVAGAARANAQTFVRACWPGALAPDLEATRLGFAFVAARRTGVGVVAATEEASDAVAARLRLWGFVVGDLTLDPTGWMPTATGAALYYRSSSRVAAQVVADGLRLGPDAVIRDDDAPRPLVLIVE